MKLFFCKFMFNFFNCIKHVQKVFMVLCLLSIFITALPFKWWYFLVSLTILVIAIVVFLYWIATNLDDDLFKYVYDNSDEKIKTQMIKLREELKNDTDN